MSKTNHDDFRIEWDLHELGPRPRLAPPHIAHGPRDPVKLLLALAVAHGDVPANASPPKDKAA